MLKQSSMISSSVSPEVPINNNLVSSSSVQKWEEPGRRMGEKQIYCYMQCYCASAELKCPDASAIKQIYGGVHFSFWY